MNNLSRSAQMLFLVALKCATSHALLGCNSCPAVGVSCALAVFTKQLPVCLSSNNGQRQKMAAQKTVLITGCSRGIGLALVEEFASKGWQVLATCRSPDRARELAALLKKQHQPAAIALDSADDGSITRALQAVQKLGVSQLDLLFHNAGVAGEDNLLKTTRAELDSTFTTNVSGPMVITQTFLPLLKAASQPKVVFMSTIMSSLEMNMGGGMACYRITKTALNMLVRQFAGDVPGLISMAMHPGWVQTDLGNSVGPAPLSPAASCSGMYAVIESASSAQNGKFIDYQGRRVHW
ncbi:C-factor-like isoform X1 [Pollicipes pollicipes]|uniref:C-factor-like isoform X1 n=2 Tax=Pollicipes pollicipes TaxID=41117 RepID=UPI001884A5E8|nr:C-factor-like isoform X1 [Pollicipes pollicipes]